MNTVAIGTQVIITLDRHCFQGDTGTVIAVEDTRNGIRYDVQLHRSPVGSLYYSRNQFVIYQEAIDQGKFPAAHPRETLCAEYAAFCDKVNVGWTEAETIAELRRQNDMLHRIIDGLNDKVYALERKLNPKPAPQPWKAM